MPILISKNEEPRTVGDQSWPAAVELERENRLGIFQTCAHPGCGTGWLHLLRSRDAPIFEGGWNCSAGCTAARMLAAVRREMEGSGSGRETHRHRVPLGLVMLEQGWITPERLREALAAQRTAGTGRLGEWLVRQGVDEDLVTRALGLQWSCAVFPLHSHDPDAMTATMPRLLLEAFSALPLRTVAGKLLYLGFEDRLDTVLALSLERMSGLRVVCGVVRGSLFQRARARVLCAEFPPVEVSGARSQADAARVLARAVERFKPAESRLVRVHDFLWLRMWRRQGPDQIRGTRAVTDAICSIGLE